MLKNQLALENHGRGIKYVIDFNDFLVYVKGDNPAIIPLSDVLNIAAIYKAGKNERAAGVRKERAIKLFGEQRSLDFRGR